MLASCPSVPMGGEEFKEGEVKGLDEGGGGGLKKGEGRGVEEGEGGGGLNCVVVEGAGSVCFAPYDRDLLLRTRGNMPVQTHRRPDVYYKT